VVDSWRHALIGWNNGDVSVVDLLALREIWSIHAHVHAVNVISLCRNEQSVMTLAADNYLKLWSLDRFMSCSQLSPLLSFGFGNKNFSVVKWLHRLFQLSPCICSTFFVFHLGEEEALRNRWWYW